MERGRGRGGSARGRTPRAAGRAHLETVSVHEHLGHGAAAHVHVLDLLRRDVLALSQLEDVLLTVDDLQDAALARTHTRWCPPPHPESV